MPKHVSNAVVQAFALLVSALAWFGLQWSAFHYLRPAHAGAVMFGALVVYLFAWYRLCSWLEEREELHQWYLFFVELAKLPTFVVPPPLPQPEEPLPSFPTIEDIRAELERYELVSVERMDREDREAEELFGYDDSVSEDTEKLSIN